MIAKQISFPLSYLPHVAVQQNYQNPYCYNSQMNCNNNNSNLHSSQSNNVKAHIKSNPDPTRTQINANHSFKNDKKLMAEHDSYYLNEIINLRL